MGKRKTLIDESDSGGSGSDYLDSVSLIFNFFKLSLNFITRKNCALDFFFS